MKYLYLAITILCFTSCEDVIELPLEEGPKRLVIDANINWKKGTDGAVQRIKLTESAGYYDTTVPAANGATVKITNSSDVEFPFTENAMTGIYETATFVPELNETYELTVTYKGEVFSAEETLVPVVDIEYIEQSTENIVGEEVIKVEYFYIDPVDEVNFYINQFSYPSEYLFDYYGSRNDEFSNGELNSVFELDDRLAPGNNLILYFYGASEGYFNYFNLLQEQLSSRGPFGTPPASVKGNCINTTNPDNKPLGYFRLSEMTVTNYTIE